MTKTYPPLSLYVHIPWCERKCPYCDFNSHLRKSTPDEAAYVNALIADLAGDVKQHLASQPNRSLQSIFIGGGTPSLFTAGSIKNLLRGIEKIIPFDQNIEITLEANPGSSETSKFAGFREAGVNRLSVGIQSFNDEHLTTLGRVHDAEQALQAAHEVQLAGFDNFNLDIMFGLPEQSIDQCMRDMQIALELQPTHLSFYQLTIEPNTLFHHNPPITPGDELLWAMQQQLQAGVKQHGFAQYEVSAYALADKHCRHNMNYWQFGDYLGIGAGAHGKVTYNDGSICRYWKAKHPNHYLKASDYDARIGKTYTVESTDLAFEFMMNALRLNQGFEKQVFIERTGLALSAIQPILEKHEQQGLLTISHQIIQPTAKGLQFVNSMLHDYLQDNQPRI